MKSILSFVEDNDLAEILFTQDFVYMNDSSTTILAALIIALASNEKKIVESTNQIVTREFLMMTSPVFLNSI